MEIQTARRRVDDIAGTLQPTGNLFFVWVTLNEQKWISLLSAEGAGHGIREAGRQDADRPKRSPGCRARKTGRR